MNENRTVRTERLLLRPFEPNDVDAYTAIRAKPDVVRYLPGGVATVEHAPDIAQRTVAGFAGLWSGSDGPGYGPWAVVERTSGRMVGHLGLRLLPELGETELLYMLDSDVWGRGYATEGARMARDYGFDRLGLRCLVAMALPDNSASLKVMKRIGMTREPGLIEAFGLKVVRCTIDAEDPRR